MEAPRVHMGALRVQMGAQSVQMGPRGSKKTGVQMGAQRVQGGAHAGPNGSLDVPIGGSKRQHGSPE